MSSTHDLHQLGDQGQERFVGCTTQTGEHTATIASSGPLEFLHTQAAHERCSHDAIRAASAPHASFFASLVPGIVPVKFQAHKRRLADDHMAETHPSISSEDGGWAPRAWGACWPAW